MEVNLNAHCSFVLTEAGAKLWNRAYEIIPTRHRPAPKQAGDFIKTQLWEMMEILGPETHLCGEQLIVGNNVDIEAQP